MSMSIDEALRKAADNAQAAVHAIDEIRTRAIVRSLGLANAERDQLKAELAKLQAEREPRDNGDGTVTELLPVTHAVGFDVIAARVPRKGDRYVCEMDGEIRVAQGDHGSPGRPSTRLILRPAPQPPESVTWTAPLIDGEWTATSGGFTGSDNRRWLWDSTGSIIAGLSRPAVLGKYRFVNGVGTLIQEAT